MPTGSPLRCPRCGKKMKHPLSKAAPDKAYQCLNCDNVDPLDTQEVQGWLNSELAKAAKIPKE